MKKTRLAIGAALLSCVPAAAMAGYAEDRAEIENLSNAYMIAVDAGDIDTVMNTWADDGVLKWVGGKVVGKANIRKTMSNFGGARRVNIPENATSRPRTHHMIVNHVIYVNGNTAHSIAYWFNLTNATPQKDVQPVFFGHYEDQLVKRNGKWLFKERDVYNESLSNRKLFYPGLGEKDPRRK